jgi:hypothetical protein
MAAVAYALLGQAGGLHLVICIETGSGVGFYT